jgi:hypothetical protein
MLFPAYYTFLLTVSCLSFSDFEIISIQSLSIFFAFSSDSFISETNASPNRFFIFSFSICSKSIEGAAVGLSL